MISLINSIANLVVCISIFVLIVDIYASTSSPISRYPRFKTFHVKAGLSLTAAGSLFKCADRRHASLVRSNP